MNCLIKIIRKIDPTQNYYHCSFCGKLKLGCEPLEVTAYQKGVAFQTTGYKCRDCTRSKREKIVHVY